MTNDEWREAFRRVCIITEFRDLQRPSAATGPNGECWCPEAEQFDPEANARAILDDEKVLRWNDLRDRDDWLMKRLLAPPSPKG